MCTSWLGAPFGRRGFTLIEMLVSLTITLMMMGAVVTLFGVMSDSVNGSRAIIEMQERLRHARNTLQSDLQGATATMHPPLNPALDQGYFEYIEGQYTDKDWLAFTGGPIGDNDDVLMFTTRSRGEPFVGKLGGNPIESDVAEVAYFAVPNGRVIDASTNPPTKLYTLYRRVLLVRPGLLTTLSLDSDYYNDNDVSAHAEVLASGSLLVPNSLGALTKPENRFAHFGSGTSDTYPFALNQTVPTTPANRPGSGTDPVAYSAYLIPFPSQSGRLADDVLMTNVLSFDVQVFDPSAPVQVTASGVAVAPPDPGWTDGAAAVSKGAYVDLGYAITTPPFYDYCDDSRLLQPGASPVDDAVILPDERRLILFPVQPTNPPPAPSLVRNYVYDTWSLHYEDDGKLQNATATNMDRAANGLDDDMGFGPNGLVDDITERETLPPFMAELRGIRVKIRAYEPSSQQVREVVVVQDFLPE